jgi:hypothetical protein
MTFEDFNHLVGGFESVATVIALGVGAYWTYTRFIKQRENFAFIEFTVDMNFVGRQDGYWIVELIAYLENKGKVQHRFSDLAFDLEALFASDPVRPSEQYGGQAHFPHEVAKRSWLPSGSYFIEPGIKAKYSYVAQIPAEASFAMLHGRFTYENQPAWHTAERTLVVPNATGNGTVGAERRDA